MDLCEKVILVTGASGCIGRAIAWRLAEYGAEVILHYNQGENNIKQLLTQIEKAGGKAHIVQADVSNKDDVDKMFLFIKNCTKRLDGVVNNVGVYKSAYIKATKQHDWDQLINVNMKSIFLLSKASINLLSKSHDSVILNIASIAGIQTPVMQMAYSASKAGVIAMTRTMAKEFGRFNIRVNSISPGPVRSKMHLIDEQEEQRLSINIPLKRIAEPEDIADVVVCFCLPLTRYITGQNIIVDGGFTL